MGLDTYAVKPDRNEDGEYPAADEADFASVGPLVGGLLSGFGNDGTFRGKVYSYIVEEATGESLYQEYIPPERVAAMADRLAAYEPDDDDRPEEFPALRQFFAVCKDRGYGLVGWW